MSRPLTAKGGGASPSLFSTPGSPAQLARESVNAFGGMQSGYGWKVQQHRDWPRSARAVARMSLSPPSSAAPLALSTMGDGAPAGAEGDERLRVQQLYREHSPSLVRQLTRKTGCRELARELANETFLR